LTEILHESTSLSVLDGDEIIYLARSATKRVMSIGLSVGSRLPSYCTSMGRVMIAALPAEALWAYLVLPASNHHVPIFCSNLR
jgi:IclR family pca regulon transcriptional regulator